jgi:hypothetical protein
VGLVVIIPSLPGGGIPRGTVTEAGRSPTVRFRELDMGITEHYHHSSLVVFSSQCIRKQAIRVVPIAIVVDGQIIMNKVKKPSGKGTISTHEMRSQFGRILQAVKAGRSLTLTYREPGSEPPSRPRPTF